MTAQPEMLGAAVKMLLSLVLVLGLFMGLFFIVKRYLRNGSQGGGNLIKVISSCYIGVKKSIVIVQVPGALLVLGLAGERVQLLSTIEDPELIEKVLAECNLPSTGTFGDQLRRWSFDLHSKRSSRNRKNP
jgi:flagellar protein FliO/FliZ